MRVRIDDDRCKGHGMCCGLCPEVFELTDDGYVRVLVVDVPAPLEDVVHTAVTQCPECAIAIEE